MQEGGRDPREEEEGEGEEEEPYTFAEIDDNDYDTVLAQRSTKQKSGGRSFIINRPPAPAPRPPKSLLQEGTTPYIARVFQQKARSQSDGDKFPGPKKQDRARDGIPVSAMARSCLDADQEELIVLQERVRNGELTVDKALERFRRWQQGKEDLEARQQEKLRQLRDCIIGNRPGDENFYGHLTIVHHPNGKCRSKVLPKPQQPANLSADVNSLS
ncbi:B-cell scaffold protein with ankyrin repeats [Sorex fumeus]|uniref:B-cell scaffold protein with ankyrin repeats n=1 Tax=Sorex fumeus TaxID=62283 RepID=UPI0024ACF672|nr:B-cell scaffold protein with ankyrin repeats [Sorex fumeus]